MTPQGFNPMRWDCSKRGCYNVKHRPKIEMFADVWPGKISMGDVDGIVEISGNALMLEWKTATSVIPSGQRIMYSRLSNGKRITIFCVCGDAETMEVSSFKMFYDGREVPKDGFIPLDLNGLKDRLKNWCAWAQRNPRIST